MPKRLLKKAHLLCCAQSPRFDVATSTSPLVDCSRLAAETFLNSLFQSFSTLCLLLTISQCAPRLHGSHLQLDG
jgi:hypothetical protein